jgi:hypothetical protein
MPRRRRLSHRNPEVDRLLATSDVQGFADYLEENGGAEVVSYLYATRRLNQLPTLLRWPSMARYFLRPMGHVAPEVFQAVAKLSPSHATFVGCWESKRHKVDDGTLYADLPPGIHSLKAGNQKLFVKVETLEDEHDTFTFENELRFSEVSVALALNNLCPAVPFANTSTSGDRMVCTSVNCGRTVYETSSRLSQIIFLSLMALGQLRLYGGLHHRDCHLKNFVWEPTKAHTMVWATEFETGLEAPQSSATEYIEGLEMKDCRCRVTVIDGGLSCRVEDGRKPIHMFFNKERRTCGWDEIDVTQTLRMIGWDLLRSVTRMKNGTRVFIPTLHFDDIPESAVDPTSFLVCMYLRRRPVSDTCLKILGALVRLTRSDPELGIESFIEFMARAGSLLGGITFACRARQLDDYVIPLPQPGEEVTELLQETSGAVFLR